MTADVRILCLTPRLPYPPDRGDRLRAFHIIEHLAREHELSLVSFIDDQGQRAHVAPLADLCREVRLVYRSPLRALVTGGLNLWRTQPLQALYYRSREMHRVVDRMVETNDFDAVYVHLFRMAQYVAGRAGLHRIVDLTDMISREIEGSLPYRGSLSRVVYSIEKSRVERCERWVASTFEETWLISEADRRVLAAACPAANIRVIPNGVDLEALRPEAGDHSSHTLIFVGHLRVLHNVDSACLLAKEILPLVRRRVPDARLQIVGADPHPRVRRLETDPAVTVTGYVPDLNRHLNRASVFVAPLRFAAGVQNKVLEAMAAARPVVTSTVVNAGLGAEPGTEILIADDPASTADHVITLLGDEEARARIGANARRFVSRTSSWHHVVKRMAEIENGLRV